MPTLLLLDQPDHLLAQVVAFLTEGWEGGLLDLSETALVLPTQEARRRLNEALVRKTSSKDSALLPPVWLLPMQLTEGTNTRLPPPSLEQLLWIEIIQGMSGAEAERLFPRKAPDFDSIRAAALGETIRSLRAELSQTGMTLHDAAQKRPDDPRWETLSALESRYIEAISKTGYTDRMSAQLQGSRAPALPRSTRRLVIAGVPDLPNVYEGMIPQIERQGGSVIILAYDPMRFGKTFFDNLGRPNGLWTRTPIPLPRETIHLCLDQEEEGNVAALLVKSSGATPNTSIIGMTTANQGNIIGESLHAAGIPTFNPAGITLDKLPIGRLLQHIEDQLRESDFQSILQLLRHSSIQEWLGLNPLSDLELLDNLQNELIPSDLIDLLNRWPEDSSFKAPLSPHPTPGLKKSLQELQILLTSLLSGYGVHPVLEGLKKIFETVDLGLIPGGRETAAKIKTWLGHGSHTGSIPSRDILSLLLSYLRSGVHIMEKKASSIELSGWLELLWEDTPHLVITGMNDGLLPETRQEDPFLPERIRLEWGLPSEKSRLCRDSYLLLCLSATRRHDNKGRLDLLLAQSDGEGTLLKPSRLLMRCADDAELPGLVSELFRELPARPVEPWKAAWALTPERKKASGILSASAIRDYLACPTRFYLKHVLKVRKESYGAVEADAATFGKLLHDTLRDFGNDPKLKSLSNPDKIAEALVHRWKELFHARYGSTLSFPLIYQREAGIRRLRAVASIQASLRSEGWEIIVCEQSFKDFTFPGIPSGMQLNGQIDRIDRRMTPSGVQWRIIDYKSSEKDKDPQKQHYRPIGKSERTIDFPACEILELNNKTSRWIDLQLPLYRMVLLSEMTLGEPKCLGLGDLMRGEVEAGYLVIPAKISDTSFTPFEGIAELEQSARECLQGVLEAIREGVFWPPRNPQYDDYQGLFFDRLNATPQSGQQTLDPVHLVAGRTS